MKGLELDLAQMLKRKDKVVRQNNDGILYLFKKNKVTFFHGRGSFGSSAAGRGRGQVGGRRCTAKHVIVATGSSPRALPGAEFDNKLILDNAGALAIPEVPKRLGVIGAGVIGLEMGSVWRRLGSEVTMLEALPAFLGAADEAGREGSAKIFAKQGLEIELGREDRQGRRRRRPSRFEYTDSDGAGTDARSSTGSSCRSAACRTPRA